MLKMLYNYIRFKYELIEEKMSVIEIEDYSNASQEDLFGNVYSVKSVGIVNPGVEMNSRKEIVLTSQKAIQYKNTNDYRTTHRRGKKGKQITGHLTITKEKSEKDHSLMYYSFDGCDDHAYVIVNTISLEKPFFKTQLSCAKTVGPCGDKLMGQFRQVFMVRLMLGESFIFLSRDGVVYEITRIHLEHINVQEKDTEYVLEYWEGKIKKSFFKISQHELSMLISMYRQYSKNANTQQRAKSFIIDNIPFKLWSNSLKKALE